MIWALCVVILCWVVLYLPALREILRRPMTDGLRAEAPGSFATLSAGRTHYRWLGPKDGPLAVCVHGITTPAEGFVPLANHLTDAGHRVLIYDLYGRGYSDYIEGPQDAVFFITQLEDLLAHEGIVEGITLIGYSAGGCIATAFAKDNLHRLRRLILIAPLGYHVPNSPIAEMIAERTGLSEILLRLTYPARAHRHLTTLLSDGRTPEPVQRAQYAQTRRRGFYPSNLSAKRGVMRDDPQPAQAIFYSKGLPVLVIWGETDSIIPASAKDTLAAMNPSARQRVIAKAGHGVLYTDSAEVAQIIGKHH